MCCFHLIATHCLIIWFFLSKYIGIYRFIITYCVRYERPTFGQFVFIYRANNFCLAFQSNSLCLAHSPEMEIKERKIKSN